MTPEKKHEYNQTYYYKNQEKILTQKSEYWKENKPKLQKKNKEYYTKTKEDYVADQRAYYAKPENRRKKLLMKSRERARETGMEWNLTVDDIVIPEFCPYLGIKLTHELGKGQLLTNSSIDRIDSTKGYIPGNIQVISRLANNMKTGSTREQREAFANAILSNPNL